MNKGLLAIGNGNIPRHELIFDYVVNGAGDTVMNIPVLSDDYDEFLIIFHGGGTTDNDMLIFFNGVTTGYNGIRGYVTTTSYNVTEALNFAGGSIGFVCRTAGDHAFSVIRVYAPRAEPKQYVSWMANWAWNTNNAVGQSRAGISGGTAPVKAPVNLITLSSTGGAWKVGTRVTVYGIAGKT